MLATAEKKATHLSLANKGLTASNFDVIFATEERQRLLEVPSPPPPNMQWIDNILLFLIGSQGANAIKQQYAVHTQSAIECDGGIGGIEFARQFVARADNKYRKPTRLLESFGFGKQLSPEIAPLPEINAQAD